MRSSNRGDSITFTTINEQFGKGQQDVTYVAIIATRAVPGDAGCRLRIDIRRDTYDFQSHARIEVWSKAQTKWEFLGSIPYGKMSSLKASAYGARITDYQGDVAELLKQASAVLDPLKQQVLMICQGGLVQEVVGLASDDYEICDCDTFEGPDETEGEQYFDDLSDTMKKYLRTTGWNKELPPSRQENRSEL